MIKLIMICWKCNKEIDIQSVYRNSECPSCKTDLHCCKQCKFYSTQSHLDCKENISEPVIDKEKSNFCEYFSVKLDGLNVNIDKEKAKAAKDAFNALFG